MPEDLADTVDPNELTVVTSTEGDAGIVRAVGELDANSAPRLRAAFDELFEGEHPAVVVDLEGVSFIDSSGLSVLIAAYKQASARDVKLSLRSPSPAVTRLLEMTGQTERFLG